MAVSFLFSLDFLADLTTLYLRSFFHQNGNAYCLLSYKMHSRTINLMVFIVLNPNHNESLHSFFSNFYFVYCCIHHHFTHINSMHNIYSFFFFFCFQHFQFLFYIFNEMLLLKFIVRFIGRRSPFSQLLKSQWNTLMNASYLLVYVRFGQLK